MPINQNIPETVISVLGQTKDKRPTEAIVHGIDGGHADIRLDDSVSIVRHVEVIGNIDTVNVGDTVQIAWKDDGRPVVMLIGSGGLASTSGATVVPDNVTIENSSFGLRVKKGGVSREHLSFMIPDEFDVTDALTRAGWTVDQTTGIISNTGISISPAGGLSLGSGNDIVKISSVGSPDDPASPEDDTEYRLWVGHVYPYAAGFAVTKYGDMIARKGVVGGWSIASDGLTSDTGNAVLHAGARPYIGLGASEFGDDGFWAGKDTDYIYKVSIGSAAAGRLTYDGTDLTLDNLDFNMYNGSLWTLEIASDGNFTIGADIDVVSSTSMKIFTTDQSWDSESFTAGDILIGDHSGAHMSWDQSEGQLQFRDGSVTGITTRAYIDTDGSIMFGSGQGRLDDSGFVLEASGSRDEEYYWNSVSWVDGLSTTGETLTGRLSGGLGEIWIYVQGTTSRASMGTDAEAATGWTAAAWMQVTGKNGGEFWNWGHNEELDGVNISGDLQHWVWASPFSSPPQAGFGHRTAWYLQDGASSMNYAAFMDVVWVEGWGTAEPGSAFKFFVYPDAGMTEMFRIGPMESTGEDPYAAVVNPEEHSEGNFLVMGGSGKRLIETDSNDGWVSLGGNRTRIQHGSGVTPPTGADYGLLVALAADDLLYWIGADGTSHDLTASAGGEWTQETGYLRPDNTTETIVIGAAETVPFGNQLLINDGDPYTGWSSLSYGNIYVKTPEGYSGLIFDQGDVDASYSKIQWRFGSGITDSIEVSSGIGTAYDRTMTLSSGSTHLKLTAGGSIISLGGNGTLNLTSGNDGTWTFNYEGDNVDYSFQGDTSTIMEMDGTTERMRVYKEFIIPEINTPSGPSTGAQVGHLYGKPDGKIYYANDSSTEYDLTVAAAGSEWTDDAGGFLYPTEIADAVVIGATGHGGNAWLEINGGGYAGSGAPMGVYVATNVSGVSVNDLYGFYNNPEWSDATNTLGDLFGVYNRLGATAAGDITNVYGYWTRVEVSDTDTIIANYYGLYLSAPYYYAGAITASTGILIEDDTSSGTFVAIDVEGGDILFNSDLTDSDFIVYGDVAEVFRVDAGLEVAQISTWLELKEVAAPITGEPGTGWGAIYFKSDGKVYAKNDGGTEYDLTSGVGGGEWTESGGFLTQGTGTDIVQVQNWMELEEVAAPATGEPGTGFGALYAMTDGHVHYKNDSGTEFDLTDTTAGSGVDILEVQVFM